MSYPALMFNLVLALLCVFALSGYASVQSVKREQGCVLKKDCHVTLASKLKPLTTEASKQVLHSVQAYGTDRELEDAKDYARFKTDADVEAHQRSFARAYEFAEGR